MLGPIAPREILKEKFLELMGISAKREDRFSELGVLLCF